MRRFREFGGNMVTETVVCPRCKQKFKGKGSSKEEAKRKAEENAAYHQKNSRRCRIEAVKTKKK